ncbi:surfeit locus 1 family protein [Devosia crocina]|uniref:SURF1-like protein n=1 Tax=Devosia crocina TaxID=429728 RepID=A0A1I7N1W9_9HYPH|nr:SURF1 family protein [Devosia crocina]SFV28625.1 surfeit locus 1 family protein [Devosia crocina]
MTERKGQGAKLSPGLLAFCAFCLACAIGFAALGIWQINRLAWKNQLIVAVETRSTSAPVDLDMHDWGALDPVANEYLRVSVSGRFGSTDAFAQAVTVHGGGFWVLTPLTLADGRQVLVNRGFVPSPDRETAVPRPPGNVTVTGLLRQTEPEGGFLRSNDAQTGRWYSRDVAAISATLGIDDPAPFFIDADATGSSGPIGGLTVLSFPNNHLVYALTWFGLTLLALFGFVFVLRDRWQH